MFGYATDETEELMPLTHVLATRIGYKLTQVGLHNLAASHCLHLVSNAAWLWIPAESASAEDHLALAAGQNHIGST